MPSKKELRRRWDEYKKTIGRPSYSDAEDAYMQGVISHKEFKKYRPTHKHAQHALSKK